LAERAGLELAALERGLAGGLVGGLVGELAARAGPRLAEIRSALLVRQALLTLKARVHCLSSTSPPLTEP